MPARSLNAVAALTLLLSAAWTASAQTPAPTGTGAKQPKAAKKAVKTGAYGNGVIGSEKTWLAGMITADFKESADTHLDIVRRALALYRERHGRMVPSEEGEYADAIGIIIGMMVYERGFKFGEITYGLLKLDVAPTKANGYRTSMWSCNHGLSFHPTVQLAKKVKGKIIVDRPAPRGEFAFDRIQAINREYDPNFKWKP